MKKVVVCAEGAAPVAFKSESDPPKTTFEVLPTKLAYQQSLLFDQVKHSMLAWIAVSSTKKQEMYCLTLQLLVLKRGVTLCCSSWP